MVVEAVLYLSCGEELMDDKWLTVKEVAEYLQLSPDQIYHLAQQEQRVGTQPSTAQEAP